MKTVLHPFLILAAATAAFADSPKLTVRQEVELYNAISSIDKGQVVKGSDGKEQHLPFVFSAESRWTLSGDAAEVKSVAESWKSTSDQILADLTAKFHPDPKGDPVANSRIQAEFDKQTEAILSSVPEKQPTLKFLTKADLNLDQNSFDSGVLVALRVIVKE